VPALRFVILNFIAAVVWAVLITSIGYLFGNAVELLFGRLRLHLHMLIAIAAIAVILAALAYLIRRQIRGGSVTR